MQHQNQDHDQMLHSGYQIGTPQAPLDYDAASIFGFAACQGSSRQSLPDQAGWWAADHGEQNGWPGVQEGEWLGGQHPFQDPLFPTETLQTTPMSISSSRCQDHLLYQGSPVEVGDWSNVGLSRNDGIGGQGVEGVRGNLVRVPQVARAGEASQEQPLPELLEFHGTPALGEDWSDVHASMDAHSPNFGSGDWSHLSAAAATPIDRAPGAASPAYLTEDSDAGAPYDYSMLAQSLDILFGDARARERLQHLHDQGHAWPAAVADNIRFLADLLSGPSPAVGETASVQVPPTEGMATEPAARGPRTKLPRGPTSSQWWTRLLRLHPSSLMLPSALRTHIARPPAHALVLCDSPPDPPGASFAQLFAARVAFMASFRPSTRLQHAVAVAHCLFFAVAASDANPKFWRLVTDVPHGTLRDLPSLCANLVRLVPDPNTDAKATTALERNLRRWRTLGCKYAFLAGRIGLGGLLLLIDFVKMDKAWGMTKGREKGKNGAVRAEAVAWLKGLGVVSMAETSGAEEWMQGMLWNLCAQYPHRPVRRGEETFPGLHGEEGDEGEDRAEDDEEEYEEIGEWRG
ncbi:hypothetical protein PSPO01_14579 [Paraphaeosphaeria sporulosa]